MINPGSNLLKLALTVISPSSAQLKKFVSFTTSAAGSRTPVYADPVPFVGSVQAVPRNLYQQLGLDAQKSYINVYDPNSVLSTVEPGAGSDRLVYGAYEWQALSDTDWSVQDGWKGALFVRVAHAGN